MKKINVFLAALLSAGVVACGGSGSTTTESTASGTAMTDTTAHSDHDHSKMASGADTLQGKGAFAELKPDQKVFFANLKDGDVVKSPFKVQFGVEGMTVEPAGYVNSDKGHHHLLINLDAVPKAEAIPMNDSTRLHFGKGQTETELKLAPGKYKLTMQFADGFHQSYGPQMSASVNIEVKQ
ncbi:MAG: DUF4399 domain-containing protein [Bernardetiaceae bacterium]|nr:DUF4399 domain-containing protein [Bernardetiaceae bacterium]